MRKTLLILVSLSVLALSLWALWPAGEPTETPVTRPDAASPPRRAFAAIDVQAAAQGLTLTGVVRDVRGAPVPDAEVSLAASAQETVSNVSCRVCSEPLLTCHAHETLHEVASLLEQGQGVLNAALTVRTDAQGRFRFERLSGVSFTVWAEAPGMGRGVHERAAPGDPVELFLPEARVLTGTVRGEENEPLVGARIQVLSMRAPLPLVATSAAGGRFSVQGLGEGPFYVLATAPGHLPSALSPVDAASGAHALVLTRERTLEVHVTDGGRPAEAAVMLGGDHLMRKSATKKGVATFTGLPAEDLVVRARAGNRAAVRHSLSLSAPHTRLELALEALARLSLTLVDEQGQPAPTPTVILSTLDGVTIEERKGGTGEPMDFDALTQGDYLVSASAPGFSTTRLKLTLGEGATETELVLSRGVFIQGRVLDEYGRPADGVSVLVSPVGTTATTDKQGAFTAEVPSAGLYTLQAHHSEWGGGQTETQAPAEGVEISLEPKAGAEVTVMAEGRRIEGADAVLWTDREGAYRSDRTSGVDGVVKLRGLPSGAYQLTASHPDYLPSPRQQVTLEEGNLLRLTVELGVGAALEGRVLDDKGMPIPGATVSVLPRGANAVLSDSQGEFRLRPLKADGAYRVRVAHPEFETRTLQDQRAGGGRLEVVLERRQVFRGRVVSNNGEGLRRFELDGNLVESSDGRFERPLPMVEGRLVFVVSAQGYEPLTVDRRSPSPELGDLVLKQARKVTGRVLDQAGPVDGAVVSCDPCDATTLTDVEGRFELASPTVKEHLVTAKKGARTGTAKVLADSNEPLEIRLSPAVKVTGRFYGGEGGPAAGRALHAFDLERGEPQSWVTAKDGSFEVDLSPGFYRIVSGETRSWRGAKQLFVELRGNTARLDVGPAPGLHTLEVQLQGGTGRALWLVRGNVGNVTNPATELQRVPYAQVVYLPASERVFFDGLAPGEYTLISAGIHASPGRPVAQHRVHVPSGGPFVLPDPQPGGG